MLYKWNASSVSKIITNQVHVGNMIQSKSVKVSYKSNKNIKNDKSN